MITLNKMQNKRNLIIISQQNNFQDLFGKKNLRKNNKIMS